MEAIRINALLADRVFRLDNTGDCYPKTTQALTRLVLAYTCKFLRCLDLAQVSDISRELGLAVKLEAEHQAYRNIVVSALAVLGPLGGCR